MGDICHGGGFPKHGFSVEPSNQNRSDRKQ
jgi:hypothetical protein